MGDYKEWPELKLILTVLDLYLALYIYKAEFFEDLISFNANNNPTRKALSLTACMDKEIVSS